ncbi:helix-hairpin-helix domain-containing protein, partial [Candidatus Altiarchaeota archaeon]
KMHCSNLAADGLHKAIENFRSGRPEGMTREEIISDYLKLSSINEDTAGKLYDAGIISLEELFRLEPEEFERVPGLSEKVREDILKELETIDKE